MSTTLIVGRSFKNLQQAILDRGDNYLVLRDIASAPHPEKRLKHRVLCDFSDEQKMLSTVHKLKKQHTITGVITIYENYIRQTALIAKALRLPGLPVDAADACTDKYRMRTLFMNASRKISPDFAEVNSFDDARMFTENHSFPVILKPANLAKSLLVSKINDTDELYAIYHTTREKLPAVYQQYAPHNEPKLIIEEFMEGSIHSVDAFVDGNGTPHVLEQVADYQTGYDIGYDDNFHYSRLLPSSLPVASVEAVRETAAIGCRALGMKNSPAHIEIILTKEGPRIVEIGARNGGYRERMHGLANGINILENALRLAHNEPLDLTTLRTDSCAVLELFPKQPGIFTEITNEAALKNLSSLYTYAVKQKFGTYVGSSSDGYKMCAIIILHSSDKEQFAKDLAYIKANVMVRTTS